MWSKGFRNLKGLYMPIQISLFHTNTTQVIATGINLEIQYTLVDLQILIEIHTRAF